MYGRLDGLERRLCEHIVFKHELARGPHAKSIVGLDLEHGAVGGLGLRHEDPALGADPPHLRPHVRLEELGVGRGGGAEDLDLCEGQPLAGVAAVHRCLRDPDEAADGADLDLDERARRDRHVPLGEGVQDLAGEDHPVVVEDLDREVVEPLRTTVEAVVDVDALDPPGLFEIDLPPGLQVAEVGVREGGELPIDRLGTGPPVAVGGLGGGLEQREVFGGAASLVPVEADAEDHVAARSVLAQGELGRRAVRERDPGILDLRWAIGDVGAQLRDVERIGEPTRGLAQQHGLARGRQREVGVQLPLEAVLARREHHQEVSWDQHPLRKHPAPWVLGIVRERPALQIDRVRARVVELDPIARVAIGVLEAPLIRGQDLVHVDETAPLGALVGPGVGRAVDDRVGWDLVDDGGPVVAGEQQKHDEELSG